MIMMLYLCLSLLLRGVEAQLCKSLCTACATGPWIAEATFSGNRHGMVIGVKVGAASLQRRHVVCNTTQGNALIIGDTVGRRCQDRDIDLGVKPL